MRSTNKHRYLQAVRRAGTGEVPFQELEFAQPIVEALLGKAVPRIRCFELPGEDLAALYRNAGCDMVYVSQIWELGPKNRVDAAGRKHCVDGLFKTRESLRDIVFPDLDDTRRRLEAVVQALAGTGMGVHAPRCEDAASGRSQRACARTARKALSYHLVEGCDLKKGTVVFMERAPYGS